MDVVQFYQEVVQFYQENEWKFRYEPKTHFIGAYHPNGGKQSVCEVVHPFDRESFGFVIAEFLNKQKGK